MKENKKEKFTLIGFLIFGLLIVVCLILVIIGNIPQKQEIYEYDSRKIAECNISVNNDYNYVINFHEKSEELEYNFTYTVQQSQIKFYYSNTIEQDFVCILKIDYRKTLFGEYNFYDATIIIKI